MKWALMIRVRYVNYWTWTTLQVFDTYKEAERCRKPFTELVEFKSEKWNSLRAARENA